MNFTHLADTFTATIILCVNMIKSLNVPLKQEDVDQLKSLRYPLYERYLASRVVYSTRKLGDPVLDTSIRSSIAEEIILYIRNTGHHTANEICELVGKQVTDKVFYNILWMSGKQSGTVVGYNKESMVWECVSTHKPTKGFRYKWQARQYALMISIRQ